MKIHTFSTGSEDLSPNLRAIARIRHQMPGKGGKVREDWHPVIFHAATEEAARAAAQEWWDAEAAKEQAKRERAQARGDSRKKGAGQAAADALLDEALAPPIAAILGEIETLAEVIRAEPEDEDPGPIL